MSIDTAISSIMTRDVVAVTPDTAIPDIARLLWEHKISGVPVVEDGRVAGMVTEYDLISQQTEYEAPMYLSILSSYLPLGGDNGERLRRILATTARELMTSPVVVVHPDANIQDVATIMYEQRINAVPVVSERDGRLVGIVSRADIVRLMAIEAADSLEAGQEP